MPTDLQSRIEAALRGDLPVAPANSIPGYYGVGATADDVHRHWLRMRDRMLSIKPQDEAFYADGIAYWAARARGEAPDPGGRFAAPVVGVSVDAGGEG